MYAEMAASQRDMTVTLTCRPCSCAADDWRSGNVVACLGGSAYDLVLTRWTRRARIGGSRFTRSIVTSKRGGNGSDIK